MRPIRCRRTCFRATAPEMWAAVKRLRSRKHASAQFTEPVSEVAVGKEPTPEQPRIQQKMVKTEVRIPLQLHLRAKTALEAQGSRAQIPLAVLVMTDRMGRCAREEQLRPFTGHRGMTPRGYPRRGQTARQEILVAVPAAAAETKPVARVAPSRVVEAVGAVAEAAEATAVVVARAVAEASPCW